MTTVGLNSMDWATVLYELGPVWLPTITDLDARLWSNPPARIADINCGLGWSSISMAKAYLKVHVDGFDLDEASIEIAWANAHREKLMDRITFHVRDVGDGVLNGRYDLVTAFKGRRTMNNPVDVLATMWRLAGNQGTVLVMEQPTSDSLYQVAVAAGFREVEILPIKNNFFQFYRLHR